MFFPIRYTLLEEVYIIITRLERLMSKREKVILPHREAAFSPDYQLPDCQILLQEPLSVQHCPTQIIWSNRLWLEQKESI